MDFFPYLGISLENFRVLLAEHKEPLSSPFGLFARFDGRFRRVRSLEVFAASLGKILKIAKSIKIIIKNATSEIRHQAP
jgi:hypothetical protein